jgi:hypothetical protein
MLWSHSISAWLIVQARVCKTPQVALVTLYKAVKQTLMIAYNGGAYGTYLEWVLSSLMSDQPLALPFTEAGNSHAYRSGHGFADMIDFQDYLESDLEFDLARLHPKTESSDSMAVNLEFALQNVPGLILLYPGKCHELMCVGNYMTKIWSEHAYHSAMRYVDPNDIYQNYDVDPGADLCDLPLWIQREHMSFNLFDAWRDQVEWYFPDQWQHPRAMIVTTKDLFDDFENVLFKIQDFWGQRYKKKVVHMLSAHQTMMRLQSHLGNDQRCEDIVSSVIDTRLPNIEFGHLDIVSQAWIQRELRNRGFGLKCNDLNEFPTSSTDLARLIYPYNSVS